MAASVTTFDCKGNQKKINEAQDKLDKIKEKIIQTDINGDKVELRNALDSAELLGNELLRLKAERRENKCDFNGSLLDTQICLSSSTVKRKL